MSNGRATINNLKALDMSMNSREFSDSRYGTMTVPANSAY
jgi:hypothetical protein